MRFWMLRLVCFVDSGGVVLMFLVGWFSVLVVYGSVVDCCLLVVWFCDVVCC